MSLFCKLFAKDNYTDTGNAQKLKIALTRAEKIKQTNGNDGIYDFMRALLYPSMYAHLYDCLIAEDHCAPDLPKYYQLFPTQNISIESKAVTIPLKERNNHPIDLSKDVVFTTPWHPGRISKHLGCIGHRVDFKEDPTNHKIIVFYPMKISFVIGGHHSIMQGILNGKGIVHATEYCDLSENLKQYSYDGDFWIDNKTKKHLCVLNHDFGLIWELSKLLD